MASIHAAFRPFRNLPASSRAPWGRATLSKAARFKCILLTCAAAGEGGAGGAGSPGGEDDAITRAALAEAVELARRAQALAQQQARAELEQSWLAGGASGGLGGGDQESRPEALVSFLEEQGLTARQAEQALAVLAPQQAPETSGKGGDSGGGAQRRRPLTRAELEAKWLALGRVLAGANLAAMVRISQLAGARLACICASEIVKPPSAGQDGGEPAEQMLSVSRAPRAGCLRAAPAAGRQRRARAVAGGAGGGVPQRRRGRHGAAAPGAAAAGGGRGACSARVCKCSGPHERAAPAHACRMHVLAPSCLKHEPRGL